MAQLMLGCSLSLSLSQEGRTGVCVFSVENGLEEAKKPGRRLLLLSRSSLDLYREVGGCRTYLGGKTDLVSNEI